MDRRHPPRGQRSLTPLVQAGLALLVAGTLVTFSFLAFRTGFAEQRRSAFPVAEPGDADRRPVLLPSPGHSTGQRPRANERNLVAATTVGIDERAVRTRAAGNATPVAPREAKALSGDWLDERSGSSVAGSGEGWESYREPSEDKHGKGHAKSKNDKHAKGHAKSKKAPRALGHQKHGHHSKGRGHAKHDH